jgi:hypothetical protein
MKNEGYKNILSLGLGLGVGYLLWRNCKEINPKLNVQGSSLPIQYGCGEPVTIDMPFYYERNLKVMDILKYASNATISYQNSHIRLYNILKARVDETLMDVVVDDQLIIDPLQGEITYNYTVEQIAYQIFSVWCLSIGGENKFNTSDLLNHKMRIESYKSWIGTFNLKCGRINLELDRCIAEELVGENGNVNDIHFNNGFLYE